MSVVINFPTPRQPVSPQQRRDRVVRNVRALLAEAGQSATQTARIEPPVDRLERLLDRLERLVPG